MKHQRLVWFLILLVSISLACNLPGQEQVSEDTQKVNSVSVSPHRGTGAFSATVNGEAFNGTHTLRCYVSSHNQGDDTQFTGKVSGHSDLYQTFPFNQSFKFTYTVPGSHALVCLLDDSSGNAWSDDFVVSSSPDNSGSEPPATQPPVPEPPAPEQFKTATLFYLSYINQDAPGKAGPPYWCFTGDIAGGSAIPPLSVAPDGNLTGPCKGSFKSGSISISYSGTTTGHWDTQTGKVTWAMDMSIQQTLDSYSSTRIINIHDSAPITTAPDGVVSAQGVAEWTASCHSSADVGPVCTDSGATSYNYHGTLNWKMTFNP